MRFYLTYIALFTFMINYSVDASTGDNIVGVPSNNIGSIDETRYDSKVFQDSYRKNNSHLNRKNTDKMIEYPYRVDGNTAYIGNQEITGADVESFEVIPSTEKCDLQLHTGDNGEYFKFVDSSIPGGGLKSMNLLKESEINLPGYDTLLRTGSRYSKDKNSVYFLGRKITGADPKTFKILKEKGSETTCYSRGSNISEIYSKDKNNVYYGEYRINADSTSFEKISDDFWKDESKVFSAGDVISSDSQNFQVLKYPSGYNSNYSKDSNYVYWRWGHIIKGADPSSFELITTTMTVDNNPYENLTGWAKDKNYYYNDGGRRSWGNAISAITNSKIEKIINERGKSSKFLFYIFLIALNSIAFIIILKKFSKGDVSKNDMIKVTAIQLIPSLILGLILSSVSALYVPLILIYGSIFIIPLYLIFYGISAYILYRILHKKYDKKIAAQKSIQVFTTQFIITFLGIFLFSLLILASYSGL